LPQVIIYICNTMKQMYKLLFLILIISNCCSKQVVAQTDNLPENKVLEYIATYRDLAIYEQIRVGIPAAITLAQGILESGAGTSDLTVLANNHFGIKCKNNWTGETMLHDDETKDECFRKYNSYKESYTDHSNYIRNNRRYSFLFDIPVNNYDEWAVGLRKAGYATNPKYSVRLINLITKYNLQSYTLEASVAQKPTSAEAELGMTKYNKEETDAIQLSKTERKKLAREKEMQEALENEKTDPNKVEKTPKVELQTLNGLKGFNAIKGTNLIYEADMRGLKPSRLIDYNELEDAIVPMDMFIYAEKKLRKAAVKKVHIVQEDEDMYIISQKEGIQLRSLLALNKLGSGEEPVKGARIYLQEQVSRRPNIKINNLAENTQELKPMEVPALTEIVKEAKREELKNVVTETAPVPEPEKSIEKKEAEIILVAPVVDAKSADTFAVAITEPTMETAQNTIEQAKIEETPNTQQVIDPQDMATNVQAMLSNTKEPESLKEVAIPIAENKIEIETTPIKTTADVDEELNNAVQEAAKAAAQAAMEEPIKKATSTIVNEQPLEVPKPQEVTIVRIVPKSPSTYNEPNVSQELRNMKRIMDDVVYAAPIIKAPKPVAVPKPIITKPAIPKPIVPKPKTIVSNATAASKPAVKDTIAKKTIKTKASEKVSDRLIKATPTKTATKTIAPKGEAPNKNTTPIAVGPAKQATNVDNKKVDAKKTIAAPTKSGTIKTAAKIEAAPTKDSKNIKSATNTKTTELKKVQKPETKPVTKKGTPTPAEKPKTK
jgi:hypothetical protein